MKKCIKEEATRLIKAAKNLFFFLVIFFLALHTTFLRIDSVKSKKNSNRTRIYLVECHNNTDLVRREEIFYYDQQPKEISVCMQCIGIQR